MTGSCTAEDCRRLTTLYLCTEHIVELDGYLEDVTALIELLDGPITMTSVTKGPGQGNGSGHPGSKPPVNLDALLLRAWLATLPGRAHAEAMDNPEAGRTLYMARMWVTRARQLVWGNEAEVIDHEAIRQRIEEADVDPVPPRQAMDYIREKTKIIIKVDDFKNWVKLGHLRYVLDHVPTFDKAQKIYFPLEVFRVAQRMRDRRVKL